MTRIVNNKDNRATADSFFCKRCGRDLFSCPGHADIEILSNEPQIILNALKQGEPSLVWQTTNDKEGNLRFVTQERMCGYLREFFQHLYETFQPLKKILPVIPLPPGKELLPFQIDGIHEMYLRSSNILLADEMGLGKTIQVLGYINMTKPRRVLIICPNSVKLNWRKEAEDWLVDKYEIEIAGTGLCMFSDFTIINYEAVTRWGAAINMHPWDLVVVDEGHYIKNPSAARSKAVYSIKGTKNVLLTGTPIVNYPFELFPLIHWLDKETWPSFQRFASRYTYGSQSKYARNLSELQHRLREGVMIRRLKKEVLKDLPRKRRQIIEFSKEGYEDLLKEEKKIWEAKDNKFKGADAINEIMQAINASKETDNDPDFAAIIEKLQFNNRLYFEQIARMRHKVALAKVNLVIDHLDTALDYIPGIKSDSDNKIVVFGHHRDVLSQIHNHYGDKMSVLIMGGEDIESRHAKVQRFQNDKDCRVFCGGMSVAGLGLTLTAASHVVFAEMDWVPGVLTQAEDRCHRIGQEASSVLIQHLVLEDSLDAYMAKTVINKQKNIDKALNR